MSTLGSFRDGIVRIIPVVNDNMKNPTKDYKNYHNNQKMRREGINIRKIVNGKPVSFLSEKTPPRPIGAF